MSLTRGGSLGVYFVADDSEAPEAASVPMSEERVSLITNTPAPTPDILTPGAPPKARATQQNMDYTGIILGVAGIMATYFLMTK